MDQFRRIETCIEDRISFELQRETSLDRKVNGRIFKHSDWIFSSAGELADKLSVSFYTMMAYPVDAT